MRQEKNFSFNSSRRSITSSPQKTTNPESQPWGHWVPGDWDRAGQTDAGLVSYTEIKRIFSQRKNDNNTNYYYVKRKNLPYIDATWEDDSIIKTYYNKALANNNAREKAKSNLWNYKESIKFFKETFKPLKEQPSFIGIESLRLRDYQIDGLNFLLKPWHNGAIALSTALYLSSFLQILKLPKGQQRENVFKTYQILDSNLAHVQLGRTPFSLRQEKNFSFNSSRQSITSPWVTVVVGWTGL